MNSDLSLNRQTHITAINSFIRNKLTRMQWIVEEAPASVCISPLSLYEPRISFLYSNSAGSRNVEKWQGGRQCISTYQTMCVLYQKRWLTGKKSGGQ